MLDRVARTIARHRMFEPGQSIGVAVSGGADSVCLLHILLDLAPRWDLRLTVLHLDHQLRGEESRQDAAFVRSLAARFQLPCLLREANITAAPGNLEQAARHARLAFFRDVLASGAACRIATGHTRSDQAETVLYRFLRGAGTAGLAAIRPVTADGIVRPLIELDRTEILAFLNDRGLAWREDATNADPTFARNRIRHHLLPQLAREWNPAIAETLANTADWALAEEGYWKSEIDRWAADQFQHGDDGALLVRAGTLAAAPLALARRLVRRAFELVKGDLLGIDFHHIETVLELAARSAGAGRVQAPGLEIRRSFEWLRLSPAASGPVFPGYRLAASVPGCLRVPGTHSSISLELIEKTETFAGPDCVYNSEMGCLDWRRLSGSLVLRNWQAGDQYQPSGSTGETKLKTLFQQARIPVWERALWPVLTDRESIIWSRHFGPAAEFAAGPGTVPVLRIREVRIS